MVGDLGYKALSQTAGSAIGGGKSVIVRIEGIVQAGIDGLPQVPQGVINPLRNQLRVHSGREPVQAGFSLVSADAADGVMVRRGGTLEVVVS